MRRLVMMSVLMVLALVATACRGGDDDSATTTVADTAAAGETTTLIVTPSGGSDDGGESQDGGESTTTTATTQVVSGTPTYEVAQVLEDDQGDTLIVVVEPGSYTEVELANLVFDIVDRFQPLGAVVVDDPEAVPLVTAEELSDEEQTFLDSHTFLRITDGIEVTFSGPYEDVAGITVGS
jgi:hypothetical protein